ncbi:MAG: hypothetical protein HY748_17945 [Elusimicrobia bacterium]|nr:hypothetical protein [Elusimicrobiota bacterium]
MKKTRLLVLSVAATAMVAAGWVQAQTVSGGVVRAWQVPYVPVSPGVLAGLQGFLRTDIGTNLLSQAPSLGVITGLNPDYEAHRSLVGALGLPADFDVRLQDAIRTSDGKALSDVRVVIRDAGYGRNDGVENIRNAVEIRAGEIFAAVNEGKMSVAELSDVASELAPFASVSPQAKAVGEMAGAARSANAMDAARRIASALMKFTSPEPAESMAENAADPAKKMPQAWRLRAAGGGVQGWTAAPTVDVSAVPGHVAVDSGGNLAAARALLAKLRDADNIIASREIIDNLRILAENSKDEWLQVAVTVGLVGNLRRANLLEYRALIGALVGISDHAASNGVRETIIRGVLGDMSSSGGGVLFWREALDAAVHVAAGSGSERVRMTAVELMTREIKRTSSPIYRSDLAKAVAAIWTS